MRSSILHPLGGECPEDFDHLRDDRGLEAMLGYKLPAAPTGRQWLDLFHDPELLKGRHLQGSFIAQESPRLVGLHAVGERTVCAYWSAVNPGPLVTLDVDGHLVQSSKSTTLFTYESFRGYQPLLVQWAETGLILADQFRNGHVPALGNTVALPEAHLPIRSAASRQW